MKHPTGGKRSHFFELGQGPLVGVFVEVAFEAL